MRLSEFKRYLENVDEVIFKLPNGSIIPSHFHVTEIGVNRKKFIDCGGNIRNSEKINFQLWTADDFDHNLSAQKLLNIIDVSEKVFFLQDLEIEVEYQQSTIGIFGLDIAVAFERPGYRVARRKIKHNKIGKTHRINAEECQEYMTKKFNLEVFKV